MSSTSFLAFAMLVVLITLSWSQPGKAAPAEADPEWAAGRFGRSSETAENKRESEVTRPPLGILSWMDRERELWQETETAAPAQADPEWAAGRFGQSSETAENKRESEVTRPPLGILSWMDRERELWQEPGTATP